METVLLLLNGAVLLGLFVGQVLLKNSLTSYASEKGKNLATKEDVAEITSLVEATRIVLQQHDRVEVKKYELKYAACLRMLKIVDAQISHLVKNDNGGEPAFADKQFATAEEMRTCHNELILALDNAEIVKVFVAILTGISKNAIQDLDRLRSLTRAELGFTGEAHSDVNTTWIGRSVIKG